MKVYVVEWHIPYVEESGSLDICRTREKAEELAKLYRATEMEGAVYKVSEREVVE